jgi:triacylglycerol lipase
MPLELYEDAYGDPRNAQALAAAADLAYLPEAQGAERFRQELGLDAKLISVGNTQAYVASNPNHLVVAFRGSEAPTSLDGFKDWFLTDAVNLLIVPEGRFGTDFAAAGVGCRFHRGFTGALEAIWEPLFAAVDAERKKADRPFWVTGHSLGGALAILGAWLFQRRSVGVHQVYTFGAPMIGNADTAAAFDRTFPNKVFRYVNSDDPVPKLPTVSLLVNDYGHCLTEVTLGAAVGGAAELFQQLAGKAADGLIRGAFVDEVWGVLKGRINAHLMDLYRSRIGEKLQG